MSDKGSNTQKQGLVNSGDKNAKTKTKVAYTKDEFKEMNKRHNRIAFISGSVFIILILVIGWLAMRNNGSDPFSTDLSVTPNPSVATSPSPNPVDSKVVSVNVNYQKSNPSSGDTLAFMKTNMGDIKIRLFPKEAPKAVQNFTELAKKGYYNGVTFHRIINDFMIQGGDPTGTGTGGESIFGGPFEDEFTDKLHNFRGALSMANAGSNTNGSQFFIVQKKNMDDAQDTMKQLNLSEPLINAYNVNGGTPWLDNKHTVFGQVYEGMDIVDKIAVVEVGPDSKPTKEVKIEKIEITTFPQ